MWATLKAIATNLEVTALHELYDKIFGAKSSVDKQNSDESTWVCHQLYAIAVNPGNKCLDQLEVTIKSMYTCINTGADPGFLKGGSYSQADMTDVLSQKSAEELPNMHASTNWVSW